MKLLYKERRKMIKCDEKKPYIFISYAHKDGDKVYEIIGKLEDEGYNVWYDGGIDPGTEWDQNIASHVKGCAYFIAFVSKNYIASENCKDELNYARDLDKDRLLVYIEDVELPDGMAMRMNRIQAIWWNKYDNEKEAYNKIFSAQGIERGKTGSSTGADSVEIVGNRENQIKKIEPVLNTSVVATEKEQSIKKKVPIWVWIVAGVVAIGLIIGIVMLTGGEKENSEKKEESSEEEEDKDYEGRSLEWYIKEAEGGDAKAMLYAADCYYEGKGTNKNYEDALEYYKQAQETMGAEFEKDVYHMGCYAVGFYYTEEYEKAAEWFKKTESVGELTDAKHLYVFGRMCNEGHMGEEKDYTKALEYCNKALEAENADEYEKYIYYQIGAAYYGLKDHEKEYAAMHKSHELGYTSASRGAGDCCYYGRGVEQDYAKALEYYKAADDLISKSGVSYMSKYAECYYMVGEYEKAAEWLKKAESTGELTDGYMLSVYAWLYFEGYVSGEKDYVKALEYCNKSLEDNTYDDELYTGNIYNLMGNCYQMIKEYEKAYAEYEKAYIMGVVEAAFNLGNCYYNGWGVKRDYGKALEYYNETEQKLKEKFDEKIIKGDYALCYYKVGEYEKAVEWFKKAESVGELTDGSHICAYGACYFEYYNNYEVAIEYFNKAAEVGNGSAMYNLGYCYENGYGVVIDLQKAKEYYQIALEKGNSGAKAALERLEGK